MVAESLQEALNKQINMELRAHYAYLALSDYFENIGLKGVAEWVYHHAVEEMMHAMKIYHYLHTRRDRVKLFAIPEPVESWDSPTAALEYALHQEEKVTASINRLVHLAREEADFATDSFLQWFVDEQVEEEEVLSDVLDKLRLIADSKPGLYLLDRELAGSGTTNEAEVGTAG
jgi:ferritin